MTDDFQIDSEVWLRPNLTREDAEDMLTGHPDGAFIVRRSASDNNSWVLSYVYGGGMFKLDGFFCLKVQN